jgi:hypothetical protein
VSNKGLNELLEALFASEGGGDYQVENKYGYIGKYQFGEDALVDTGYYKADDSKNRDNNKFKYDWIGQWTGKNGAQSKVVFLSNPEIQDQAAKDWVKLLCKRLHLYKLDQYVGKTIAGIDITESGIIAAAHLKGFGNTKHPGVIAFLKSNGKTDATDANGTPISKYMRRFAGYTLGCCAQCAVQVLDRDKEPVAGLAFKLLAKGKEIYHGFTDAQGRSQFMGGFSAGHELTVLIQRLEGGYKEIAQFAARHTPMVVTLTSPKVMLEAALLPHAGPAGTHESEKVSDARKSRHAVTTHKRATGAQRNAQGNPVEVAKPPAPLPPIADRLKTMQEILLRNVNYGSKDEPLSGPAAVIKSRRGGAISEYTKPGTVSLSRCYKYVKIALQASGMVDRYLAGEHAKDAGPELEREGFTNLLARSDHGIEGPMDAPLGAVIVYDTTDGSPHGHIEIRVVDERGKQVVVSDYISDNPRTQRRGGDKSLEGRERKVSGIWVKN